MTFDQFCAQFTLSERERANLVWHLAAYRARRTVEMLMPVDVSTKWVRTRKSK